MTLEKKSSGRQGEDLAASYLKKHGYKLLGRNIVLKIGEIDILARPKTPILNNKLIVLVEVKTKSGQDFGQGYEMVNYFKRKKLLNLAKSLQNQYPKSVIRIDVVSVDLSQNPPGIRHFENAVEDN